MDEIRRKEGAADPAVDKVTAAVVARCIRATATPCEATRSVFADIPRSCGTVTLKGQSDRRVGIRIEVLDRRIFTDTRRDFLACLNGPHPAIYGSGLPRTAGFRARVRVTDD